MGNLGWSAGMQGDLPAARAYHERALVIAREVGNIYQETYTLINLSAVTGIQQDAEASLAYAQASADLSRKNGERSGEAWSLLYLGYGYLMLGDLEQAESAFQGSIQIRTELGQPALLMEPVAGLIQVHLEKNDRTSALVEAERILSHITNGGTLEGTEEPLRIYFTCYSALRQNLDPRADDLLNQAYSQLVEQISRISDHEARRMYVENVPWRRAIQQSWQQYQRN